MSRSVRPCPYCRTAAPFGSRFCATCGQPLAPEPADDITLDDRTRVEPPARPAPDASRTVTTPRSSRAARQDSGERARSGSSARTSPSAKFPDHGRFAPGHLLGSRYRIVKRLGRGGMGEVYLADDLTLGQSVALKFLPESVERDLERLEQLQDEVRMARQVSHPNICRVYDIAETDGVHFLTMEYVDGEDLSTLIKRIGRLPEDRAVEMARQLAAGVAAAHARGVLHRDLKPANVMLDGDGRVRVTDFGLAVASTMSDASLAGTPAYMAPEQLAGDRASARSDVYALGLVLYELFTGRRAYSAKTLDDLREQHLTRALALPTEIVPGLHRAIEAVILHCLDPDPAGRPPSALAVAAALPGGDPLAAALAAGETPSPEMVAASGGGAAALSVREGAGWLMGLAVALALCLPLADRVLLIGRVPLPLSLEVLADRARTFEASVGFSPTPVDTATGTLRVTDAIRWILERPAAEQQERFRLARPAAVLFWSRSSPRPLVPRDNDTARPGPNDPPFNDTGMTQVVLDTTGRLLEFASVPVQRDASSRGGRPVDWQRFFTAAGLDLAQFTAVPPEWTPQVFADRRDAWTGEAADLPGVPLRVEAASHDGVAVNFQVVGPWARPARMTPPPTNRTNQIVTLIATGVIVPFCLVGGLAMARRNLQRGRGDRRGALVLAGCAASLVLLEWMFDAIHYLDVVVEQSRFAAAVSRATVSAAVLTLLYLAIEPHVRRVRPAMLVTWTRLVAGRFRDPLLGRDLAAGATVGVLLTLITFAHYRLPDWFGWQPFVPADSRLTVLEGAAGIASVTFASASAALKNALLGGVGLLLAHLVVKHLVGAFALATLLFAFLASQGQIQTGSLALDFSIGALLVIPVLFAIVRYGFVAGFIAFFVHFVTKDMPVTVDPSRPYFGFTIGLIVLIVATAVGGVVLARRDAAVRA